MNLDIQQVMYSSLFTHPTTNRHKGCIQFLMLLQTGVLSFHILPMYPWDSFLEVGMLGEKVNPWVIVPDIVKSSPWRLFHFAFSQAMMRVPISLQPKQYSIAWNFWGFANMTENLCLSVILI